MTTETKDDSVEYMNMLTRVDDPSKPLTYEEDLFRRIAWACDIIVERDEVITNLQAEIEWLRETIEKARVEMYRRSGKAYDILTATLKAGDE